MNNGLTNKVQVYLGYNPRYKYFSAKAGLLVCGLKVLPLNISLVASEVNPSLSSLEGCLLSKDQ